MTPIHTLHILNKPPEHPRSVACMNALRPGDALLLTENAVLALAVQGDTAGSTKAPIGLPWWIFLRWLI